MKKTLLSLVLAACASTVAAQAVQKDDMVFGYSRGTASETLELVRDNGGGPASYSSVGNPWTSTPFIQFVEFDNLGGIQHNAGGNLIGGNFGTTGGGGSISSLATDGSGAGTTIATFNVSAGLPTTRIGSPAVSPKNSKIAVPGYDSGELHILDYSAGTGNGASGSTSNHRATATGGTIAVATDTQGSAWLNDRTALIFNSNGVITAVDSTDMSTQVVATVPVAYANLAFGQTDIDFQPAISPYVYAMSGERDNGAAVTVNRLFVLDPRNGFSLVGTYDFSAVDPLDPIGGFILQTAREIAFDSDGDLLISQFFASAFIGTTIGVDYVPGAANPANIVSNGSLNSGFMPQYSANFNGFDVANTTEFLDGDATGDGTVSGADYTVWADNFGFGSVAGPTEGLATVQMGDFNLDGAVTGADYTIWADNFGATAATAVPEPASLTLAALALVGGLLAARRRG